MTETVTVRKPNGFTQSLSGEPRRTFDEATTVMYLEPQQDARRSTEALEVGYVPLGDWLGVGLATFDFGSWEQIVWNGRVFDIIAPPRVMPNPRLGTMSHTELDLQLVGDDTDAEGAIHIDAVATPGVVGGEGGV